MLKTVRSKTSRFIALGILAAGTVVPTIAMMQAASACIECRTEITCNSKGCHYREICTYTPGPCRL